MIPGTEAQHAVRDIQCCFVLMVHGSLGLAIKEVMRAYWMLYSSNIVHDLTQRKEGLATGRLGVARPKKVSVDLDGGTAALVEHDR